MKQKETPQFSWTGLLGVTAACFFIFSLIIKIIDGSAADSIAFFTIGIISLVLYAFAFISLTMKPAFKKKKSFANSQRNKIN